MKPYELIILGAGISGLAAAQYAGAQGARTLLVDMERLGGRGLMKGPELLVQELHGFAPDSDLPPWADIKGRVEKLAIEKSSHWEKDLNRLGVDFVKGEGKLINGNCVLVSQEDQNKEIFFDNILVATGSSARALSSFPFEPGLIFESDEIWSFEELPESLLIAGSNLESLSWAQILRRLGVKVFLTHEASEVLEGFDPELIEFLEQGLKRSKVKLLLKKQIKSIFKNGDKLAITLDGGIKFNVEKLMVCGERAVDISNTVSQGLEPDLGPKGEIFVDEKMKSTISGLFAAGSVTGHNRNIYRSQEEGRVAAANALGKKRSFHPEWVPEVVRLAGTVGSVGCFEGNAHHFGFRGIEGRCISWKKDHDFPLDTGDSFCKLVANRDSREIIGGQAAGNYSAEMISMIQMGVRKGLTPRDFTQLQASWGGAFAPLHEAAVDCLSKLNQRP